MLFNSIQFLFFLPIVFTIYWYLRKDLRLQNILLLIASYVFYGWWDWRFLLLLFGVGGFNYLTGIAISSGKTHYSKRGWMILGIIVNLGTLAIFKYYNFFIDSFRNLFFVSVGYDLPLASTRIILPVGISFYIFLSVSYILDIYKEKLEASENFIDVMLCLSFFPIVLAGPIQRPVSLLHQISNRREFNYASSIDGLRQILWGLFKKIVLADTCAVNADYIFANHNTLDGSVLVMGAVFFAFQIYGDFSGYSDIAIGIGRLFGFNLMRNFAFPYFSSNIVMFWQRWHISLTTWFRDYVFLPLSVSLASRISNERILFMKTDLFVYTIAGLVTWVLTGLWHGPNITFIVWGLIHGVMLILYQWQKAPRKKLLKKIGINSDNIGIILTETFITLTVIMFSWIFFKASSVDHAMAYVRNIFTNGLFSLSILDLRGRGITSSLIDGTIAIPVVLIIEWLQRNKQHGLDIERYPVMLRWTVYWAVSFFCLLYLGDERTFIYFQF